MVGSLPSMLIYTFCSEDLFSALKRILVSIACIEIIQPSEFTQNYLVYILAMKNNNHISKMKGP